MLTDFMTVMTLRCCGSGMHVLCKLDGQVCRQLDALASLISITFLHTKGINRSHNKSKP